jgi:hypothetical protein
MRDALLEYVQILKEIAAEELRHSQLLYVNHGLKHPPPVPEILKDG